MTQARTAVQRFAGVAARELEALHSLIAVLDEERHALTQGDAEALPALIAGKTSTIQALAHYASERTHLLADAGVKLQGDEIRGFLAQDPPACEIWEKVLAAARKAAGLNTANAFLTSTRLTTVSRALAVLAGPQPDFYGPSGASARSSSASRALSRG